MKFFFFKTPKPKQFEFKTRYYDAEKDEMEQRKRKMMAGGMSNREAGMRDEIRRRWHNEGRRSKKRSDMQRLVIFLVILAVLIYFIFFT
ncbi:MAG: hypothetical protein NT175_05700 [Bacteroidetes bacterium]|nr:hypothetical protein [Bacteroidota bacterium]